jgi:aminopeptidase-like protein
MILEKLMNRQHCEALGERAYDFVREIFPICRSITGRGVRETLRRVGERIPLELYEVPSGTPVFDWQVPQEWNIRDAYVKDSQGGRVIDFQESNLHVVSYSTPIRETMSLAELRPHLHSIPEHPDWIPYRTSYYRPYWGFCLRHRDLAALREGPYEVCIDATLAPGSLTYGECYIPGASQREVLVFTHVCHPSLANDNASGIAVATELAHALQEQPGQLSYRFVFAPGTIGAITWLARNEQHMGRIAHGLVLGLVGDPGPLTYKKSVGGEAGVDRAAAHVLSSLSLEHRIEDFSPYGYDERQFCSPGFDLPVGRLTRSPNEAYPQYHSSADDLSLVGSAYLGESLYASAHILAALDGDAIYTNLSPKCEPQLGKRGLYRSTGGKGPGQFEHALLWVLNQSNGRRSLLDIAERSGIPFTVIRSAASDLVGVGLLMDTPDKARPT